MDKIKFKQNEHIKMRIILPVLIVFACIIIVFLSGAVTIRKLSNKENIKQRIQGVEQLFQEYLSIITPKIKKNYRFGTYFYH